MVLSLKSSDVKQACVLCGHSIFKTWQVCEGRPIVSCERCRLFFVHPQPTVQERESQYSSDESSPADYYAQTFSADQQTFSKRVAFIERFCRPGHLLEIGCAVGTFMREAERRGWETIGIEPNPSSCQHARAKGLNVTQGFFSERMLDQIGADFDLIHMGDVIEHVENPLETIRLTTRFLKKGGLLSIITPDFASPVARKFQIKPTEHLFYFTKETLSTLLEKSGYRVEMLVRTTRKRDLKNITLGTTRLSPTIRLFVKTTEQLKLTNFVSWSMAKVIRDELFVIAQLS